jgi:hypothetical protein
LRGAGGIYTTQIPKIIESESILLEIKKNAICSKSALPPQRVSTEMAFT